MAENKTNNQQENLSNYQGSIKPNQKKAKRTILSGVRIVALKNTLRKIGSALKLGTQKGTTDNPRAVLISEYQRAIKTVNQKIAQLQVTRQTLFDIHPNDPQIKQVEQEIQTLQQDLIILNHDFEIAQNHSIPLKDIKSPEASISRSANIIIKNNSKVSSNADNNSNQTAAATTINLPHKQQSTQATTIISTPTDVSNHPEDPESTNWAFLDPQSPPGQPKSILFRAWDRTLRAQSPQQLDADLKAGKLSRQQIYAIYGYDSGTFYNALTAFEAKHMTGGQWTDPKHQSEYLHLQQLANDQGQFESNHPTFAQTMAVSWQDYDGPFAFDQNLNPSVLTNEADGPQILPRETAIEQARLFAAPGRYQSNQDYQQHTQAKINRLSQAKQIKVHTTASGNRLVSSARGISRYTSRLAHPKQFAKAGIRALGRKALARLGRTALIKGTAALLSGAVTAGVGTAVAIAAQTLNYLRRYRKKIAQYLGPLLIRAYTFLFNPWTLGFGGVGGALGSIFGPAAAAGGFVFGSMVGQWIQRSLLSFKNAASAAKVTTGAVPAASSTTVAPVYNPATGQTIATVQTISYTSTAAGITGASAAFLFTSAIGPFIAIFTLTLFVMATFLVSFTVPNPQNPQFATDASRYSVSGNTNFPTTNTPNQQSCKAKFTKLSIFAGQVDDRLFEYLEAANPPVIKLFDQAVKDASTIANQYNIIILGRWYGPNGETWGDGFKALPPQLQPDLDNPTTNLEHAQQAAIDWFRDHQQQDAEAITYWEGIAKPKTYRNVSLRDNTPEARQLMRWLGRFEATRVQLLAENGQQACIGNFGFGHPAPELWPYFQEAFDAIDQAGGVICLQEYATDYDQPVDFNTMGRFDKMYDYLSQTTFTNEQGASQIKSDQSHLQTIMSTTGVNRSQGIEGDNPPEIGWRTLLASDVNRFLTIMSQYDQYISRGSRYSSHIIGATMFQYKLPDRPASELDPEILSALIAGSSSNLSPNSSMCTSGLQSPGINIPQNKSTYSGPQKALIDDATRLACIPSSLFHAILNTETTAFNLDPNIYDVYDWWTSAGHNGLSCYKQLDLGFQQASPQCQTAYCYNSCNDNGCLPYNVMGITQFEKDTFYKNCSDPEGKNPGCQDSDYTEFVKTYRQLPDNQVPNRCRVGDAIYATAAKLAIDSHLTPGNCTYDQSHWTDEAICLAARKYCGSCGAIEDNPDAYGDLQQPCRKFYLAPEDNAHSEMCGQPGEIGYCNQVFLEMQSQLQDGQLI